MKAVYRFNRSSWWLSSVSLEYCSVPPSLKDNVLEILPLYWRQHGLGFANNYPLPIPVLSTPLSSQHSKSCNSLHILGWFNVIFLFLFFYSRSSRCDSNYSSSWELMLGFSTVSFFLARLVKYAIKLGTKYWSSLSLTNMKKTWRDSN